MTGVGVHLGVSEMVGWVHSWHQPGLLLVIPVVVCVWCCVCLVCWVCWMCCVCLVCLVGRVWGVPGVSGVGCCTITATSPCVAWSRMPS